MQVGSKADKHRAAGGNVPETMAELEGAVRDAIKGECGYICARGEVISNLVAGSNVELHSCIATSAWSKEGLEVSSLKCSAD